MARVDDGIVAVCYRCKKESSERKIKDYFGL